MSSIILEPSQCPNCGYKCDTVSTMETSTRLPSPLDFSLCMKCGQVNQFDDDLRIVRPSNEFMLDFANNNVDKFLEIQKFSQAIKQLNVLNFYKK